MKLHPVQTYRSDESLPREDQLAWRLAAVAADPVPVEDEVVEMIINRLIDNAAVAAAALTCRSVITARDQALAHPYSPGATLFGLPGSVRVSPEWAAWANGVAVRQLDFHDAFVAADEAHPGDNIPPILAVAQHRGASGAALIGAIAAAYETQVSLARGICLQQYQIDPIAHLGPSAAAGIGALLGLPLEVIYQAIQQALHVTTTTRQAHSGAISSWKAYAPAFAGKVAVEAVDRAMRGETSPSPIYEGEGGIIARLLNGPSAIYKVPLLEPGEPKRAILDTYTRAYAADYQSQALIDLARRLGPRIDNLAAVESIVIHTSHHVHTVLGSGAKTLQKLEPQAGREALGRSIRYIFTVALLEGGWHHRASSSPERAACADTSALWHKISTTEDPAWTERHHDPDPLRRAFGGRVVVRLRDGRVIEDQLALADAHPLGARPFTRADYLAKFRTLAEGVITDADQERFLTIVQRLPEIRAGELGALILPAIPAVVDGRRSEGLF